MKKILILAATVVASVSGFAFAPDQTRLAVDNEVQQRALKGETLNMKAASVSMVLTLVNPAPPRWVVVVVAASARADPAKGLVP